ncbi:hypothetical protein PJE062_2258 [Pseudovibrio sp. JE062]|nr:hypothetical protein PJE062_2258 [Pseudovibrio sp. JE062]
MFIWGEDLKSGDLISGAKRTAVVRNGFNLMIFQNCHRAYIP